MSFTYDSGLEKPTAEDEVSYREQQDEEPNLRTLEEWLDDGVAEATDGCRVEPDGYCEHGKPSWFLALGLI